MSKDSQRRWFYHGSLSRWPLGVIESFQLAFKVITNYFKRSMAPIAGESVQVWGYRVFGKPFTDKVVATGLQGIYAGKAELLSAEKIVGRFFKKGKQKYLGTVSFTGGMQEMINALVEKCKTLNVQIVKQESSLDFVARNFNRIVVATSAHEASKILSNSAMNEFRAVGQRLSQVEMLPIVTVQLKFSQFPARYRGFGMLIGPQMNFKAMGVLFSSFIFPQQQNHKYLENWILGGASMPEVTQMSEDILVETILSERQKIFGISEKPQQIKSKVWPQGLPHYTLKLEQIISSLQIPKGLYLHGNYINGIGLSQILERSYQIAEEI
jgi:oxygen-dependent protoporphyrinogen oxidase